MRDVTNDPMLEAMRNLARYHREHEKHYAAEPLENALTLQRVSRTLKALAERWSEIQPSDSRAPSPYAGAEDLNDDRAIEETGVLFMEGGGEPAEIGRIKRDLATIAEDSEKSGTWLAEAMEATWGAAESLIDHPPTRRLAGRAPQDHCQRLAGRVHSSAQRPLDQALPGDTRGD